MFNMLMILHPNVKIYYESYRTLFNNYFNIAFGYPQTETYSKCNELKIRIDVSSKDISR